MAFVGAHPTSAPIALRCGSLFARSTSSRASLPMHVLTEAMAFPDPSRADEHGLVAVGGDLSPERLLLAYSGGIFPWPHEGLPLLWFSPDPRFVLLPGGMHISRSLRRTIRRGTFDVRVDTAFEEVIRACARVVRDGQGGTWITPAMEQAYSRLHRQGHAHSVECFADGQLVGGLYGIAIGRAFFGESMFSLRPDASKVALVALLEDIARWGGFHFVDCQVPTAHLGRLGAADMPRPEFLALLKRAIAEPPRCAPWAFDLHPASVREQSR